MVDQSQKTEFEIALRDSISPGLRSISRELRALNKVALEGNTAAAETVERLNKNTIGIGFSARNAVRDIAGMTSMMYGFTKGFIGVGGTIETVKAFVNQMNDMAKSRVQLEMFSKNSKLAATDIELIRQAIERMGGTVEDADKYISTLTGKMHELRAFREGSTIFNDLQKMGDKGVALARDLLGDVDSGKYREAVDKVLAFYQKQGERQKIYLSQTFDIPQSVLQDLQANIDKSNVSVMKPAAAIEWHNNQVTLLHSLKDEWDDFLEHIMIRGNELSKQFETGQKKSPGGFAKWGIAIFDVLDTTLQQDYRDAMAIYNALVRMDKSIEDVWNKLNPSEAKGAIQERFGRFGVGVEKQLKQEENKTLEEIRRILQNGTSDIISGGEGSDELRGGGGSGGGGLDAGGGGGVGTGGTVPRSLSSSPGGPPATAQGGTGVEFSGDARMSTVGNYRAGSDLRRQAILAAATEASKNLPPGWRVEAFSGERTGAGQGPHGHGAAIDFRLIDPKGRSMGNYQSPENFAIYEKFAQDSHAAMEKNNPALAQQHRWGGYFSGRIGPGGTYGAMDLMHQDLAGGNARMAAGQWQTGLNANVARAWGVTEYSTGIDARRAILAKATADQARDRVDSDASDKWKKGSAAVKFNFNNVPEGVSTNAEADGAFKGNMTVEHKKAIATEAQ